MSFVVPTQIVDAVSSTASSAGKGAGQLLREAVDIVEHAATEASSTKGRRLRRAGASRGGIPKPLLILIVLGGAVWAVSAAKGHLQDRSRQVRKDRSGTQARPAGHEQNGVVTPHEPGVINGRFEDETVAVKDAPSRQ